MPGGGRTIEMSTDDYEALVKRLPEVAEAVNRFKSDSVQERVFDLLLSKLGLAGNVTSAGKERPRKRTKAAISKPAEDGAPAKPKAKGRARGSALSIVKDLNLRPGGKNPLKELVDAKQPKSNEERSLLALHYLRGQGALSSVGVDHVYTVYKDQGWKVPANLRNQLQVLSSTKGWIDTSDGADIKLTVKGENYVEHDMPNKKAK
jgi:hypothetical protein